VSTAEATVAGRPRPAGRLKQTSLLPGRQLRRRFAALAILGLLLAAGYLLWLRDSSVVEVRTVKVSGLSGADSGRIRSALEATARSMTTLHVDEAKLERAASAYPVVRAVEVRSDFPHGIRVHVLEHRPAALLVVGSRRVPIAGEGTVLSGLSVNADLPLIRISGALPARRIAGGGTLASVRVAGGVPSALRGRVGEIERERGKGVVASLDRGPKLIFGDGSRVAVKWAAAVRVLADPDAAGAAYVDVRIPERPAAGGLPVKTVTPLAPAGAPAPVSPAPAPAAPGQAQPSPPVDGAPTAPVDPAIAEGGEMPPASQLAPTPAPAAGGGATAPSPQP